MDGQVMTLPYHLPSSYVSVNHTRICREPMEVHRLLLKRKEGSSGADGHSGNSGSGMMLIIKFEYD